MCGINGFNFSNNDLAMAMNRSIIHRGPDNQSIWGNERITFGHVRLSIIDVSNLGNQPFHYETNDKHYTIVFNGEIYNYIEIRNELLLNEYEFKSNSDTEVILAAYDFWGKDCIHKFNGMWAFCIYDPQLDILFCSRDRLGVKPFCYYFFNGKFIFSSEIKAILEHKELNLNSIENINIESVELFFSSGMIPSPNSIYKNIYKLESGHNLEFNLRTKKLKKYKYLKINEQKLVHNKSILLDELDYLFNDSIKLRMRSDVSVGSFLSGGIDSTSIVYSILNTSNLKEFHTFSVGFEGKFDETNYIKSSYKNLKEVNHHHEYYLKDNWVRDREVYTFVFDEPFGDYSGFPTLHVSSMASKYTTVVQSGDGGDEVFGGYPVYERGIIVEKLNKIPLFLRKNLHTLLINSNNPNLRHLKEALKLSINNKDAFWANYLEEERIYSESYKGKAIDNLRECLSLCNGNLPEALRMYDLLFDTLSDRFLTKVDKASMFNSIEVRSPFLDYRFIEFSLKIPSELKFKLGQSKILLKEYIDSYLPNLPKEIIYRKKQGFSPPVRTWLSDEFDKSDYYEILDVINYLQPQLYNFYTKIFNSEKIQSSNLEYLVKLRIFKDWYDRWIQ